MTEQKSIRVMIADDEALARERIRSFLIKDPDVEIVAECGSGSEAASTANRIRPDLLFLDIQMPGKNGFRVLQDLAPDCTPVVIFVTAYDEYAIKAFQVHACDYLLKPFKKKRFEESLQWAKEKLAMRDSVPMWQQLHALLESLNSGVDRIQCLTVKENGRIRFLRVHDVDWFEAEDNYVRIHCGSQSHLIRQAIGELETRLDPRRFVRIHRGAIVNLERIRELRQWFQRDYRVVLTNGTVLPLSRRCRQRLRKALGAGSDF